MPHINDYFAFVTDKSLFFYTSSGNIVVKPEMSTTIAKLYIYTYWSELLGKGNSPSSIWNVLNSINNMSGVLTFDQDGYQISHPSMLDLDSMGFAKLMTRSLFSDFWLVWIRIVVAVIVTIAGILYFRAHQSIDQIQSKWDLLVSEAKVDLLL